MFSQIAFTALVAAFAGSAMATCPALPAGVDPSTAGGPLIGGGACGEGTTCYNYEGADQCFLNPTTPCVDSNINCANWVANGFCNQPFYSDADKKTYCAKSCNKCSSSTITTTCTDASGSCTEWVRNGFCTNTAYTPTIRSQYCKKSCNLC